MSVGTKGSLVRAGPAPSTRQSVAPRLALRRVLGRDWLAAWLFLLPCTIVVLGLIAYPFVSAILLSFQAKLVGSPGVWVGLKNYQDLLVGRALSAQFIQSVRVTVLFTLAADVLKF